jgi:hypothetical protein
LIFLDNCRDNEKNPQIQNPETDSEPINPTDVVINNEHSLPENDSEMSHDLTGILTERE